jgi:hypothetical protein
MHTSSLAVMKQIPSAVIWFETINGDDGLGDVVDDDHLVPQVPQFAYLQAPPCLVMGQQQPLSLG